MKAHYIACALSSALDGRTNRLSLFHLMDEIVAPAFPVVLPSFCVAVLFEREVEDEPQQSFILHVRLDGVLLASFTMGVDFARSRRNRTVNTIQSLAIPSPGVVTLAVMQKTRVLASWEAVALQSRTPDAATRPTAKPAAEPTPRGATPNALAVN